jgi:hypothetical protein
LGLAENTPSASIIGAKSYGHPLAWRIVITSLTVSVHYRYGNLIVDLVFWFSLFFLMLELVDRLKRRRMKDNFKLSRLSVLLGIFLLSAFTMDFIHEFGHAFWGTAAGGRLAYMQIAYFVIFPEVELVSHFQLGYVRVTGLTTSFEHGLFLLGGSLTTNVTAWLLAVILLKKEVGYKTNLALKMSGIIGLLDLPLYVFLPQIGLRHWIILGGDKAEPLIGAREMGISDPIFYLAVLLTSLGLVLLYFEPLRKALLDKIRIFTRKCTGILRSFSIHSLFPLYRTLHDESISIN